MRRLFLAGTASLFAFGGIALSEGAQAAAFGDPRLQDMASTFSLTQDVQFLYSGRRYCFYVDGWRGPGFYWCGYAHRRGRGWGGERGWRGWDPDQAPRVQERRGRERTNEQRDNRGEMRGSGSAPRAPGIREGGDKGAASPRGGNAPEMRNGGATREMRGGGAQQAPQGGGAASGGNRGGGVNKPEGGGGDTGGGAGGGGAGQTQGITH